MDLSNAIRKIRQKLYEGYEIDERYLRRNSFSFAYVDL